jgi:hypothetical protein
MEMPPDTNLISFSFHVTFSEANSNHEVSGTKYCILAILQAALELVDLVDFDEEDESAAAQSGSPQD